MVRLVFLSTIYLVLLDASCAFLCATTAQATPRLIGVANATGEQEDEAGKGSAELQQIRDDWVNEIIKAGQARRNAKSPLELEQVQKVLSTKEQSFIERCMALAMKQPDSWAGLAALKLVACRSPETNEGQQAADRLVKQAATANLDIVAMALDFPAVSASSSERTLRTVVSIILERVKKQPDHSEAARLLASIVCRFAVEGEKGMQAPPEFANAADLIIERYADSPDILNFCELLWSSNDSPPPWAGSFEKHLRTILKRNKHRDVRVAASFALASVVQGTDESRQVEAERLYEEFLKQFDGTEDYHYVHLEKMLRDSAQKALVEMRSRGLGKPVPEIVGVDLNGREMRLSEYRGKVVLLSFWATWCGPCLKMVPHERELARRFEGKPFAIVGVNGDDDQQAAERAAVGHKMTWRSFRKKAGDDGRSIQEEWSAAFPSFYLVDQQGIIRKRWVGTQPQEELTRAVDKLLDEPRADVFESFPASEEKIAAATKKAKRSVVRISWANTRLFEQALCGVILTADGYVATFAFRPFAQDMDLPPGRELFVHLSDGRKVPGVAVSSAPEWAFGLVKITQDGVWPHAEAGISADVTMGDICLALSSAPDGLIPPSEVEIP